MREAPLEIEILVLLLRRNADIAAGSQVPFIRFDRHPIEAGQDAQDSSPKSPGARGQPGGASQRIDQAIRAIGRTLPKPEANKPANMIAQELQRYADGRARCKASENQKYKLCK